MNLLISIYHLINGIRILILLTDSLQIDFIIFFS